ncbi:MAG: ABC transporter ATP-binding protein [Caldilineae bacterium]|nr:MAG: ABC transporter ATP-binding protein [Caldilineae bacterium]
MMAEPLIRTENLTKIYGSGESAVRALDGINLEVYPGELVAVMGPSGCGKSTLLNMLGALDQPTEGKVWVAGQDLSKLKDLDGFRAKTVGFVFQLHNLLPTLTARENVEVPMQGQKISRKQRRERAEYLLELVGLGDRMDHLPSQLSGGQRQRVAIARALANEPALVLADEPTGSLDSQSSEELLALLADLNRSQGTTILIVTHDRRVAQATQRILRMQDGRIVDDHRISDPLEEDLRMLARSKLGQVLVHQDPAALRLLRPEELTVLRRLVQQYSDGAGAGTPEEQAALQAIWDELKEMKAS